LVGGIAPGDAGRSAAQEVTMFVSATVLVISLALTCSFGQMREDSRSRFELRLAEVEPVVGLLEAGVPHSDAKIYLHTDAIISDRDILEVNVIDGDTPDTRSIEILVTKDGAERLEKASRAHIGKPIAVLLEGKIYTAPQVQSELTAPIVVSGVPREEAERIARLLRGN
jgi:preprotein translocase subunit SecD